MNDKPRVLVLDDDDDVRAILSEMLDFHGFDAVGARNGEEALAKLESDHPVVGIIDLMLPDVGGLEIIETINRNYPDVECIVLTAYASQESAIKAVKLGAYSFIQKPYDSEQLLLTIRRAFERHESEKAFRASEEKYRLLFENAHDALVLALKETGAIMDANRGAEDLIGCKRSELSGKQFSELFPEGKREQFNEGLSRYMESGSEVDFEAELVTKKNVVVPVYIRTTTMELWGEGAVQIIIRDITERKKAEESLKKRAADVQHISELMVDNELRMREAKKEIDTLLAELGRKTATAEDAD